MAALSSSVIDNIKKWKILKLLRFSVSISSLIALVLGLTITALLFSAIRRIEYNQQKFEFKRSAELRLQAVNEGVEDAISGLRSVNQLFVTAGLVSREQFRVFVQPMLERYPYIQAFNFHRLISDAERPAYESEMRKRFPGFSVTEIRDGKMVPAGTRPVYRVVDYIEPMQGNEKAFGFDSLSYSFQNAAIKRATETGLPAATGLLRLMQEKNTQQGVIIIMPVYRSGSVPKSAAARREAVIGDTAAVFRAGDMIEKILISRGFLPSPDSGISVYAGDTPDPANVVFRYDDGAVPHRMPSIWPAWLWYDNLDNVSGRIAVAGTQWHMVVSATPVLFMQNHKGSLYVLLSGILLSILTAAYVYALVSRQATIERVTTERTAALQLANSCLSKDIAQRINTEKFLRLRERVIDASANAIIIINSTPDYVIEYVNPAFERITGYSSAEVLGRSLNLLKGNYRDQQNTEAIRAALREKREGHTVLRTYRKDGTMYWNEMHLSPVRNDAGEVSHFVVAQYDITEAKRHEAELEFQATHDVLTGLANRNLLRDRLSLAIADSEHFGHSVWVLFVDLDRFNVVNDTLGHMAGDKILKTIARRLQSTASEVDTVARLGGDEFALVLAGRIDEGLVVGVIHRIITTIAQPLTFEEHEFSLNCSIGVAVCPTDGRDPDTLIKHADIAMYRAKDLGSNSFQFYTQTMNERTLDRFHMERDLRNALDRGQFVLHYQPQVNLHSGHITGMEALLRWQHPRLGLLPPSHFIGLAEETGLIIQIGAWVVHTACSQNKAWQQAGYGNLVVAVNLSPRQFMQKDLVQSVAAVLEQTGLSAEHLEIELTESLVMTDIDHAIGIMHDFRKLGVKLSVDDFGTGYSSLSYLKRLPLNVLKIDQSFIRDVTLDPDDAEIVQSIISLAHNLRLHVIAEGVENQEQLAFLQGRGCDSMQGFYVSHPVTADLFTEILRERKCLPSPIEVPYGLVS
ncbi:EAL domain-containing protein [Herbaspirillum sp. ST 5-3]|uniref:bifunctional diguanylate cyclase/phosphodiesterase n=1 Tax=Oxalobacteraceae TaxID=75682 RepID=UPI0010A581BD|nr:EAL domain-containing protein [Herbaspirillum sp. ST 5-3]